MKTKNIIIGLIILLVVLFFLQHKEHAAGSVSATSALSNEAIQNLAKIYADTNNTAAFNNIRATGNINAKNLNIDGNIVIDNRKPVILTIQIGSSKLPIVDLSGNTFPSDKWLCRLISTAPANNEHSIQLSGLVIGIRNNKWWIANFGGWGMWQQATVEFTPINVRAEDYYDLKSGFHPAITIDTKIDMDNTNSQVRGGWETGPVRNGEYSVYSSESRRFVNVATPLS